MARPYAVSTYAEMASSKQHVQRASSVLEVASVTATAALTLAPAMSRAVIAFAETVWSKQQVQRASNVQEAAALIVTAAAVPVSWDSRWMVRCGSLGGNNISSASQEAIKNVWGNKGKLSL